MAEIYTGSSKGFGGEIIVSISVESGKLISVSAEGKSETPNIGDTALIRIPGKILSCGSTNVDAVSGATVTSQAIIRAAESAFEKAGLRLAQPFV